MSPRSASAGRQAARAEGCGARSALARRTIGRGRAGRPRHRRRALHAFRGRTQVDVAERAAPDLTTEAVLVTHSDLNRSTSCLSRDCSRVDRRVGHRSSCRAGKLVVVAGIHSLASAERAVRALTETLATTIGGRKRVRRRVDTSEKCFAARSDAFASPRCGARAYDGQDRRAAQSIRHARARGLHDVLGIVPNDGFAERRFARKQSEVNCETKRRSKSTDRSTFPRLRTRARTLSLAR